MSCVPRASQALMRRRARPGACARFGLAIVLLAALAGCAEPQPRDGHAAAHGVSVELTRAALEPAQDCTGGFVRHELHHITRARGPAIGYYDSNGAGIAAGDLDGDGDFDLVLANLEGPSTVAWNEGHGELGWRFREQPLGPGGTRTAAILDVEGDGTLDIVFTRSTGAPSRWIVSEDADATRFRRAPLPGVRTPAFAMAWGDLDRDGDLDMVGASYDTLLAKELRDGFLFGPGAGIVHYEQEAGAFRGERLEASAQSLAIVLFDADGDGWNDVVVGNDFERPDRVFRNPGGAGDWRPIAPFGTTTRNTMGFDVIDSDADGAFELFATDMKPDFADPAALAAWLPLLERGYERNRPSERQRAENALLARRSAGGYVNRASRLGIDATGWSWSGRFGDLDLDGRPDLYVVNGMIATEAFPHLPGAELVERNRAFRATGRGFEPADGWGLGATESGRGMVLADLDGDGDLDAAINNLAAPAVLFENRLCRAGAPLLVRLRQPGSANPEAVDAIVRLSVRHGDEDLLLARRVDVTGGYLSGATTVLHFGIPEGAAPGSLEIVWPDGATTRIASLAPGERLDVTRHVGTESDATPEDRP